ncbi:MAG: ATP-binding protein [Candidatus Nanohaloarchaea archaeon]
MGNITNFDKHLSDGRARDLLHRRYEGRNLEYKAYLDFESEDHKIKFCKEVISIANTGGGYLVLGVFESEDGMDLKGMPSKQVPDENELNDTIKSVVDNAVGLEVRNYSYKSKNFPIIWIPETNIPLIVSNYKSGDKKELKVGIIYWRDSGSVTPLKYTNHIANFLSRFHSQIKDEEFVSVKKYLKRKRPKKEGEDLVTNIFDVEKIPEKVYLAKTDIKHFGKGVKELIHKHNTGKFDFIVWKGKLVTFEDLSGDTVLKELVSGPIAERKFKKWSESQKGNHDITLLNRSFSDYCNYMNLRYDDEKRRHYFPSNSGERKVTWYPNGQSSRTVVHYFDGYDVFAHMALEGGFKQIGKDYIFYIDFSWTFTDDGINDYIREDIPNKITSKLQEYEKNYQYLNNIKFWAAYLGNKFAKISMGDSYEIRINALPHETELDIGSKSKTEKFDFEPDSYKVTYN